MVGDDDGAGDSGGSGCEAISSSWSSAGNSGSLGAVGSPSSLMPLTPLYEGFRLLLLLARINSTRDGRGRRSLGRKPGCIWAGAIPVFATKLPVSCDL